MLDLIIISYKLTTNMSVTYKEFIQYPVDYTYNGWVGGCELKQAEQTAWRNSKLSCKSKLFYLESRIQ